MVAPTTSIFRQEALEFRARQQGRQLAADVTFPRLMARRAWIALWVALAVFTIGATFACLPAVPVRVTGLAVAPSGGEARIAVLSMDDSPEIGVGAEVTIALNGRKTTSTVATVESMTPEEVMRRLDLPWPTAAMLPGQVTVAWIDTGVVNAPGAVGSAEVVVGSRQAGSYLPLVGGLFRSDA